MIDVMPPRMASPSDTLAAKGIFALLFILSIGPVLLIPIPAMVDYPNHLARMFILSRDGTPSAHPFLRSWQRDFDYLYIVGPRTPNPIPSLLEELAAGSRFVLYRVRKPVESPERR